jgi:O-antigen ligase
MEIALQPGAVFPRALLPLVAATRSSFWRLCIDVYPALIAASIPWSTTAVAVFAVLWLIVLLPTIELRTFITSMRRPASWLPLAFFALAAAGMLWADSPWSVRAAGLLPTTKLLIIPLLLYQFERSKRGPWVLIAFLVSCAVLLALSWIMSLVPMLVADAKVAGVPVRNTIDQSQEFALCVFALIPISLALFEQRRVALAAAAALLALAFFSNLMFVALARTSLIYMSVLLALFAARYFSARAAIALVAAALVMSGVLWSSSSYLRQRVESVLVEYKGYKDARLVTSTGQRLEWWGRSIDFIEKAPLFGNGTGSTKQLFDLDAADKPGAWAASIGNPHNQTLNVAIQWGVFGCLILYAMWGSHLLLFRGSDLIAWIGLIVVTQNFLSSLLNSHLFDFQEGWIYVLGVGVAGGICRGAASSGGVQLQAATRADMALRSKARRIGMAMSAVSFVLGTAAVAVALGGLIAVIRLAMWLVHLSFGS